MELDCLLGQLERHLDAHTGQFVGQVAEDVRQVHRLHVSGCLASGALLKALARVACRSKINGWVYKIFTL